MFGFNGPQQPAPLALIVGTDGVIVNAHTVDTVFAVRPGEEIDWPISLRGVNFGVWVRSVGEWHNLTACVELSNEEINAVLSMLLQILAAGATGGNPIDMKDVIGATRAAMAEFETQNPHELMGAVVGAYDRAVEALDGHIQTDQAEAMKALDDTVNAMRKQHDFLQASRPA